MAAVLRPRSDGMCRLPVPPKTHVSCQRSVGWHGWAPSLLGGSEDRLPFPEHARPRNPMSCSEEYIAVGPLPREASQDATG